MKIAKCKQQHFWDNPNTMRRELYRNGKLVSSWGQDTLKLICSEYKAAGRWGTYDIPLPVSQGEPPCSN